MADSAAPVWAPTNAEAAAVAPAPLVDLGERLAGQLPGYLGHVVAFGDLSVEVEPARVVEAIRFLRDDPSCLFWNFVDLCGADYPAREKRFDVVYHLLSPRLNQRIRVKVATDEMTAVPSIIDVFPAANWFEREAYDFYGILFTGHPDLRASSPTTASRGIRCARISR